MSDTEQILQAIQRLEKLLLGDGTKDHIGLCEEQRNQRTDIEYLKTAIRGFKKSPKQILTIILIITGSIQILTTVYLAFRFLIGG